MEIAEELRPHLRNETVLAEYRNIRKSFQRNRTYAEASELFIKEMKLLRSNLKWSEKAVHYAYSALSRNGESYIRPIMISAAASLLASIGLWLVSAATPSPQSCVLSLQTILLAFFQIDGIESNRGLEI